VPADRTSIASRVRSPPLAERERVRPPANVSLAASGRISMPARLRNACSSVAATSPASRNVMANPSDSP
jgi:hypothetical protein